ncbi:TetR/AcrR family transcriptional regulator [Sphingopyxis sp. MWB1]|uniref:TetR/AcrR family transcriptional regulator n=1 Tax=Sphingopyxis sp. MWB1 TaxID=1537715 RepID=UPI00051A3A0D|nr:TetR/AcrR family transcriptional regulator [Sphingopyxis sp. MWB1]
MTTRRRGRPSADGQAVSPDAIVAEALRILDAEGLDRLTMRALAQRAGVNPMTIYHHFTDRDGLIKALAERAYAHLSAPPSGSRQDRVRHLLGGYYSGVVRYPDLTLAIFARPTLFPDRARAITGALADLLGEHGGQPRWTHILIDYTHGAALAAAHRTVEPRDHASKEALREDFDAGLTELLEAFAQSAERTTTA